MELCLSHTSALRFWRTRFAAKLAGAPEPLYLHDTPDRPCMSLPAKCPYLPPLTTELGISRTEVARYVELAAKPPDASRIGKQLRSLTGQARLEVLVASSDMRRETNAATCFIERPFLTSSITGKSTLRPSRETRDAYRSWSEPGSSA